MKFWDDIVNTALIGTARRSFGPGLFPPAVAGYLEQGGEKTEDPETLFLKGLALSSPYRRAGALAPAAVQPVHFEAPSDPLPVAPARANALLQTLVHDSEDSLILFWMELCREKKYRVEPRLLPSLLDLLARFRTLQPAGDSVISETGRWLARFHPAWFFAFGENDSEERFLSGKEEERESGLLRLRQLNPRRGRELLVSTWAGESAAMRAKLLACLKTNLSADDCEWLESLSSDSSKKVQSVRFDLLFRIPGSSVSEKIWDYVRPAIQVWREKNLLAFRTTETLQVNPELGIPKEFLAEAGLSPKSTNKNFSDSESVLFQLLEKTPPSKWEKQLNCPPANLLNLFNNSPQYQKYFDAFTEAAIRFGEQNWALAAIPFVKTANGLSLLLLLPQKERDKETYRLMELVPNDVVRQLQQQHLPMSLEMARRVLRATSKDPYNYNKIFYKALALRLPEEIRFELNAFGPENAYAENYWKTIREEIERLLSLKADIIKAFE